jgi:Peptidase family M28/PA domain
MKFLKNATLLLLLSLNFSAYAQKFTKLPESKLPASEPEMHLRFLASDEMLGRKTGEQTSLIAARYVAEQFRALGLKMPSGQNTYLQKVPFKNTKPASEGSISVGNETLKIMDDFLVLDGKAADLKDLPVVFVGYGASDEDYKDLDVKGKIVITQLGTPKTEKPFEAIQASEAKTKLAADKGAAALVEIFTAQLPWKNIIRFFSGQRLALDMRKEGEKQIAMPHIWISSTKAALFNKEKLSTLSLKISDKEELSVISYNVVGILEGSDATLKSEYIILSAHFDHIGTSKKGSRDYNAADTIFNGARDNAFGVTSLLYAAKCLSQTKPKRSIVFVSFTGEEIGLLGSQYYAEYPLVPLKQCVFNLDCDGAGYNDKTLLTTIGLGRTNAKLELEKAAAALGLKMMDDPVPEQNLFDRSDNVSFARKGIPALDFAPGFTSFNDEIMKYYHQVADNPETIDFAYLHKYCQSYTYAARLIANRKDAPKWIAGDKYEKAWKELYGK